MPRNNYVPKDVQERIKYFQHSLRLPWTKVAEVMRLDSRRRYRIVNDKIHMGPMTYARLLLLNSFLEKQKVGLNPLDLEPRFTAPEIVGAFNKIFERYKK